MRQLGDPVNKRVQESTKGDPVLFPVPKPSIGARMREAVVTQNFSP